MIRTAFQIKSVAVAILMAWGATAVSNAAETEKAPPAELVKYIRDTKRRGLTDAKIKSQAVAIGWPATTVDEALNYVRRVKGSEPVPNPSEAAAAGAPAIPPPSAVPDASATTNPQNRGVPDDYVIGAGDTLQISVWKEPEASVPAAVVRPDGKITVPLIKEVEVAGLTPTQAEKSISERLRVFIMDANVTVVVATISSKKIYVVGAARKEGPLPYTYGMTVMQALSEAGGITEYAKRKKIYILRTENGREYRLDFNYNEVVKGEGMEQNILLLPGDTVVIPH